MNGSGMGGERYGMRRCRWTVDELVGGGSQHAMTQVDGGAGTVRGDAGGQQRNGKREEIEAK